MNGRFEDVCPSGNIMAHVYEREAYDACKRCAYVDECDGDCIYEDYSSDNEDIFDHSNEEE